MVQKKVLNSRKERTDKLWKWMKHAKINDAAVYGHTFFVTNPFSFVKLFKKMTDEL